MARLRDATPADPAALRRSLAAAVNRFEADARVAGVDEASIAAASYVLCAWGDEQFGAAPWGAGGAGLLRHFHGEAGGGDKLLRLLTRLAEKPREHRALLELFHTCLSLGLRARTDLDNRDHEILRSRVHHALQQVAPVPPLVAPWQCAAAAASPPRAPRFALPAVLLLGVLALGVYSASQLQLAAHVDGVLASMQQLMPARTATAAPVAGTAMAPPRLASRLRDDIAAGRLSVRDEALRSVVVVGADALAERQRPIDAPGLGAGEAAGQGTGRGLHRWQRSPDGSHALGLAPGDGMGARRRRRLAAPDRRCAARGRGPCRRHGRPAAAPRRDRPVPAMKASVRFVQSAVNLGAAGALLWFAAPLLAFGAWHPFDDMRARVALLALVALVLFGLRGLQSLLARRRNERLLKSLESSDAGPELSQRFRQALAMLRQGIEAQGTKRWWQRRRQVQQLPWYLIIGAPGGGKTTALLHSGLRFPLAERLGRDPLAGCRRHAPMRLVVQPGRRVHRHGGTLYDAGQRRRGRRPGMAAVPRAAAPAPALAADQWRDRQRQRARPAARRRGTRAPGGRGRGASGRTAPRARSRLSDLSAGDQGRPARRLCRNLRRSRRRAARAALGRGVRRRCGRHPGRSWAAPGRPRAAPGAAQPRSAAA